MRRLAEGPDEVGLGDVGQPSDGGNVERLRVVAVDRSGARSGRGVGVLDGPAHLPCGVDSSAEELLDGSRHADA